MEFQKEQIENYRKDVLKNISKSVDSVLPKYLENMSADYFIGVKYETQLAHLTSLIAGDSSGKSLDQMFVNEEDNTVTFIREDLKSRQICEAMDQLPAEALHAAKIYSALDNKWMILEFHFGQLKKVNLTDPFQEEKINTIHAYVRKYHTELEIESIEKHLKICSERYLKAVSPNAFIQNFQLIESLKDTHDCKIIDKKTGKDGELHLSLAFGNYDRRRIFGRICQYLDGEEVALSKVILETFEEPNHERVSLISLVLNPLRSQISKDIEKTSLRWKLDLCRIPYLDKAVLSFYDRHENWSLQDIEILLLLANLSHQKLVKTDTIRYSKNRIIDLIQKDLELSEFIVKFFNQKFLDSQRKLSEKEISEKVKILKDQVSRSALTSHSEILLHSLIDATRDIEKTNLFNPKRYSLAVRVDSRFLQTQDRNELPFGVFYSYGRNFTGFHVRFRDISRGGMRIVQPRSWEEFTLEQERHYDEVYDLAYAQQLKNKDIPEGGSKAVILANPISDIEFSAKVFADCLLDLTIPNAIQSENQKDYYNKPEFIYLGPDERVSPEIINWIVNRAVSKGCPMPAAFMSSKPGAGINHKEYGVTSEGVTVFLEAALKFKNINPYTDPFTVKITGGPDGDVAGNEIRILFEKFGKNAKILGIADGLGCAEDPQGLNSEELLRLVEMQMPITSFKPEKLSESGILKTLNSENGAAFRNNMHNRLKTDVFIPAGGRPQTINEKNCSQFLTDGVPSSTIIVEGANLFITPKAREFLSSHGVLIVKDSSANKCGVICSSLEILSSMLLTEDEFMEIKAIFIEEVLEKLRFLAKLEANALFKEFRHRPSSSLPAISVHLSQSITKVKDALGIAFDKMKEKEPNWIDECIRNYVPNILLKQMESMELLKTKIPTVYIKQIIASSLAGKIVYKEGIDYFKYMKEAEIVELALRYFKTEIEVQFIINEVNHSDLKNKEIISQLLAGGATSALLKNVIE